MRGSSLPPSYLLMLQKSTEKNSTCLLGYNGKKKRRYSITSSESHDLEENWKTGVFSNLISSPDPGWLLAASEKVSKPISSITPLGSPPCGLDSTCCPRYLEWPRGSIWGLLDEKSMQLLDPAIFGYFRSWKLDLA